MGEKSLNRRQLASFCVTAFTIQALATLLITFLPEFYANAMGLPVAAVGLAFMTVRILDMMIDPVLGGLMDATRSSFGRFRPWLALSAPILSISILALFEASRGVSLLHLWAWLFVVFVGFSMIVLSHLAWTATLSRDPRGRTRVFAWWQVFATGGQFSILILLPVVARLYPSDPGAGVHVAGWVMAALIPLGIGLALKTVPERPASAEPKTRTRIADYVRLFRQAAVVRLFVADLAIALSTGVANAVALFFYMGQLGFDRATATSLITLGYVGAFAGTPLFTKLAGRIGKAKALQAGALLQAALQLAVAAQPPHVFLLTATTILLLGLCIPIAWFLPRALMADVADASEALFGVDRTGLLYATLNGTMKLALGLAVGVTFLLLGWLGFEASDAADPANAFPLRMLVGVVPALLSLVVVICMRGYPEQAVREIGAAGNRAMPTEAVATST